MNRKERRASRHAAGASAFGSGPSSSGGMIAQLFTAAVARHQAGAFAEAERGYRQILALAPKHAESLHNLGLIALQAGNAEAAAALIGNAISASDGVAEYHYNMALALRALGRMDQTAAQLERAIALNREHGLAHLNLGNVRREQGRLADAAACYERALALSPQSVAAHANLANIRAEQQQWDAAVVSYRRALALQPNSAEIHQRLGAALMAQRNSAEALRHFETAQRLSPDLPGIYENLGTAYAVMGRRDAAVQMTAGALELRETAELKRVFADSIKSMSFAAGASSRLRELLLRALNEGWSRPRDLVNVCCSLVKLDEDVREVIARVSAAWPARLAAAELSPAIAALSRDEIFVALLQCVPIADVGLEFLTTNVRRGLLSAAIGEEPVPEAHLRLYAAVAQQCFINEYVYALPADEAERAHDLRSKLTRTIRDRASIPPLWPIAVAAYGPLHALAGSEDLVGRPWPPCVEVLLAQQIKEPLQEREIAAAMPRLTAIDDAVSRAVRQQYEENPYPRWVKAGPPPSSASPESRAAKHPDVLIAGCGSGLSTVEIAQQMTTARILAVDLSLSSLSYARRMAGHYGLGNVEFAQADILLLGTIGRRFDLIETSGVLHHLADPWAGWKILLACLRPDGIMRIGLYSELARRNVVAARALIAARGYRPIDDDIRRCRDDIIATDDPLLKSLTQLGDFFSMSECRDLLFHVQEHRITLPQIKSFIAANDLQFLGFAADASILEPFKARFPERAALLDLDCWHAYETEAPATFGAMYQFWVRKPAA